MDNSTFCESTYKPAEKTGQKVDIIIVFAKYVI